MIPSWPEDLPQRVLVEGYSESLPDGRLRTAMEGGPPKVRRRFSTAPRPVSVAVRVSPDQKARLERFWLEGLDGGTLPFLMPDPVQDGAPLADEGGAPLLDETGQPIALAAWWLVAFGEAAPTFTPRNRGLAFVAAFTLQVMP